MKTRADIELLAPAGSYDSLTAAAQGGADAIYFGIEQLNMRARSSANFTGDDLEEIVGRAAALGMKAYLTVNTVVFNNELVQMRRIVDRAKEAGVDAIIASDQSVLQYCNAVGVRVHLSTQLNISNIETLKFYAPFSEVAVLARELDLEQVKEMSGAIDLEEIKGQAGAAYTGCRCEAIEDCARAQPFGQPGCLLPGLPAGIFGEGQGQGNRAGHRK